MSPPQSKKQVQSLIGMVNYLSKFSAHLSELAEPIRDLAKERVPFNLGPEHDETFSLIKKEVTAAPILVYYNPNKPMVLQTDDSPNICRRYGVEVYFKGGRTIRDILVHPKDKDTILKKSGVIYKYSCGRVDCGEEYIGESGRTFGERYREHMRSPSPIMDHHNTTGHEVSLENFTIVGREDNNIARNIREAIFIRVNDPSLNRNIGKFQLLHIWDEVLAKLPELHLK